MMHFLGFLATKKSARYFIFMIFSENFTFIYCVNLSINLKESQENFCFVAQLCVPMKQSVTRHLAFR